MKFISFYFIFHLSLSSCASNDYSDKPFHDKTTCFYFNNLKGGKYIFRSLKIEILNSFDSLVIDDEDDLVIIDVVTPDRKEYNLAFLPFDTIVFDYTSETKMLDFEILNNISLNGKVINYFRKVYSKNGLNDKIKERFSDSLTLLSKSRNSNELFRLLEEILNSRRELLNIELPNQENSIIKDYIEDDLYLSMYNAFFKRGIIDNFSIEKIDSLLNSYKGLDAEKYFRNPHFDFLLTRLITLRYNHIVDSSINHFAYSCFNKYLHPTVKNVKLHLLVGNALSSGDSSFVFAFFKDCEDEKLKNDIYDKLNNLRNKNSQESLFENGNMEQLNLSEILKPITADFIVVDVWASWCSPCIRELVDFKEFQKRLINLNAELIFISIDTKSDSWLSLHNRLDLPENLSFRILSPQKQFFKREVNAIPYKLIITKQGEVIHPKSQNIENELIGLINK